MSEKGKLYIVATPIGNLGDITLRAITVLKEVKLIAAEDTRVSKRLLNHYGINTPLFSLHAHNEKTKANKILALLHNNEDVAYITDAGTPLISDPGAQLVQIVRENGFTITPVPGPCAAIAALSVSGFNSPQFYFEGFLPNKSSARKQRLEILKNYPCTLIFYESPHRIRDSLDSMQLVLGNRDAVIAREITKKFETILTGNFAYLRELLQQFEEQRLGEFVIMVSGNDQETTIDLEQLKKTLALLLTDMPIKKAVSVICGLTNIPKNEVYALALALKR